MYSATTQIPSTLNSIDQEQSGTGNWSCGDSSTMIKEQASKHLLSPAVQSPAVLLTHTKEKKEGRGKAFIDFRSGESKTY